MHTALRFVLGAAMIVAAPASVYGQARPAGEETFLPIKELLESHDKALEDRNAPPPPEAFEDDPEIGLPVGAQAPDFPVATHEWRKGVMSEIVAGTLHERLAEKTVLLVFVPTVWDPHAFDMFHALVAEEKAMTGTNTSLIVVTPNRLDELAEYRASRRVALEMVHDPEGEIFARYNLPTVMDRFPRQRAYFIIGQDGVILERDVLWHYVGEHGALMDRVRNGAAQRAGFDSYQAFAAANRDNRPLWEDWSTLDFRRRDKEAQENARRQKEERAAKLAAAEAQRDAFRAERAKHAEKPAAAAMETLPDFELPAVSYSFGKPQIDQTTLGDLCDSYPVVLVFTPALDFKNANHMIVQFTPNVPRMQLNQAKLVVVFPGTLEKAIAYREALKAEVYVLPDPEKKVFAEYGVDFDAPQTFPRHPAEYPLWVVGPGRRNVHANPWFHHRKDLAAVEAAILEARGRGGATEASPVAQSGAAAE